MIGLTLHDLPLLLLLGLSSYLLLTGLRLLGEASGADKKVQQRVQRFGRADRPPQSRRRPLVALDRWLAQRRPGRTLARLLQEADLQGGVLLFVLLWLGLLPLAMVACSLLLQVTWQQNLLLSLLLALALLVGYLRSRRGKRERDLQAQVPEIAMLLSNSLRAGLALQQAFAAVVEKMPRPANEEFGDLCNRIRAGQTTEAALRHFSHNHPGEEIRMLITAILIQRETGGDLAKTLASIAGAVLARQRLNDEIRTATAEGRYSSLALVALSIAVLVILNMATGGVLRDFLALGWGVIGLTWLDRTPVTLGFMVLLLVYIIPQAVAFVWVRRISQVQI